MAIEIERKFLLRNEDWRTLIYKQTHFAQGYLNNISEANAKSSVRVRVEGQQANINIKSLEIGLSRDEYEYKIPLKEGKKILATLAVDSVVEKIRHLAIIGQHTWEIDEFLGANAGLIIAEVEIVSEDEFIKIPAWVSREVTSTSRYYNVSLSKHPFMNWCLNEKSVGG